MAATSTMKAAVYNEFGNSSVLSISDVPKPTAAAGQVVIAVKASGVNPVDWKLREGYLQTMMPQSFPTIPSWDAAGTIAEVGEGVTGFTVGDEVYAYNRPTPETSPEAKVCNNGCAAQFVALAADRVAAKPKSVDIPTAGAIPLVGLTAWQGLFDHGAAVEGNTVLILNASGGVGSFAVQFAKAKGLTVIATASAKNTDFVKDLGADAVVDYSSDSLTEDVIAAAGGKPVDVVFDCVGGDAAATGLAALKEGGVIVSIAKFDIGADAEAAGKGQTGKAFMVLPSAEQLTTIAELIDAGKVKMGELTTFPLADIAKAQDASQTHHVRGKMVLLIE